MANTLPRCHSTVRRPMNSCAAVALYGPSGSGKTTLLELIAGLKYPDSGKVLVNGRDVFEMSRKEGHQYRLHQLGIVGQPQNLIPGASAIQNASLKLMLANVGSAKTKIEPLLGRLGLGERLAASHRAAFDGRAPARADRPRAVHRP